MKSSAIHARRALAVATFAAGTVLVAAFGDVVLERSRDALFARSPEATVMTLAWERTHCLECAPSRR